MTEYAAGCGKPRRAWVDFECVVVAIERRDIIEGQFCAYTITESWWRANKQSSLEKRRMSTRRCFQAPSINLHQLSAAIRHLAVRSLDRAHPPCHCDRCARTG